MFNVCPNLLWCNCSSVWRCREYNLSHNSDDICQRFTMGLCWCIVIHLHQSKLNITASMVIARSQYQPLTKAIFSSPEICGNILNIFGAWLKPQKLMYKINWDTWSCILLLDIVFCVRLCLILVIFDNGSI